jgi:uncharacterized repeat protein (TIGR03803 family)
LAKFLGVLALAVALPQAARAQTFTVLHTFAGKPDGSQPYAGVVRDQNGNLYGTTDIGGAHNFGTVYKIDAAGNETILHSFMKAEGGNLVSPVLLDRDGNIYGTTPYGGYLLAGTVFKLGKGGKLQVLFRFGEHIGFGEFPGPVIRDEAGDLYGATGDGNGAVFKIDSFGKGTVLYGFQGQPDAAGPNGSLLRYQGDIYGTTSSGGAFCFPGCGTVYKIDANGVETVLYSFSGLSDGKYPESTLIHGQDGSLYGTTPQGGLYGAGTIFQLDPDGVETVLHNFGETSTDGFSPIAGLVRDSAGNFYGTTPFGGSFGGGVVYKLDRAGVLTILHSFTGGSDGAAPYGGAVVDATGSIYGTTKAGGDAVCNCGVVFKISP